MNQDGLNYVKKSLGKYQILLWLAGINGFIFFYNLLRLGFHDGRFSLSQIIYYIKYPISQVLHGNIDKRMYLNNSISLIEMLLFPILLAITFLILYINRKKNSKNAVILPLMMLIMIYFGKLFIAFIRLILNIRIYTIQFNTRIGDLFRLSLSQILSSFNIIIPLLLFILIYLIARKSMVSANNYVLFGIIFIGLIISGLINFLAQMINALYFISQSETYGFNEYIRMDFYYNIFRGFFGLIYIALIIVMIYGFISTYKEMEAMNHKEVL